MSIFPCQCPLCEDGVCDEDGLCVNCGYDYLADSEDVVDAEPVDSCEECGSDLTERDVDDGECPECGEAIDG